MSKLKELLEAKKRAAAAKREAGNESNQDSQASSSSPANSGMQDSGALHRIESAKQQVSKTLEKAEDMETASRESSKASSVVQSEHSLSMKLAELETALKTGDPQFSYRLRDIHQTLRTDPEIVTILSEEEIGLIVAGCCKHTDITIVAASSKSKTGKKSQPITADML